MAEVREYALKFLQMLIQLSEDFSRSFESKGAYDTLSSLLIRRPVNDRVFSVNIGGNGGDDLIDQVPAIRLSELEEMEYQVIAKLPYLLGAKQQSHGTSKSSYNLSMIMLDAATQKFDNVNALAPEKQTLVHTIMNRSRIAEKIVDQMHDILQKPKKVKIVYFGMIKTFLKLLVQ